MNIKPFCVALALFCLAAQFISSTVHAQTFGLFNVRYFGAKGDGVSLDTASINKAIDAAAAAGGGTVRFPAGTYLSTSIHLKSNITIDLEHGAIIEAAPYSASVAYDAPEPNPGAGAYLDFGHMHFHNSLIWGDGLENVSITGQGKIWGQGLVRGDDTPQYSANKSICLVRCRNVTLRDFTLQHGGWFSILATGTDNLTIDNLKIDTNRDGMDIDCCRDVHISNCSVNCPGDDGICLKSTYALGFPRATENTTITNCTVSAFVEGTLLDGTFKQREGHNFDAVGRIKLGTESNGGFKNIAISNCVCEGGGGLALETVDGGALEDVTVDNITMRNIDNAPLFLRLGGRMRAPDGTAGSTFRRVSISNVNVYNADPHTGCIVSGLPGQNIEDVTLSGIHLWYRGGGSASDARNQVGEYVKDYPDPGPWGTMPSYGMYFRHVRGLTLIDVDCHLMASDARPEYIFDDVSGVRSMLTDNLPTAPK